MRGKPALQYDPDRFAWGVPGNIRSIHSLPLPYGCNIYLSEFPDIATRSFRQFS